MQYNSFNVTSDGDLFNMQRKAASEYAQNVNSRSVYNQNGSVNGQNNNRQNNEHQNSRPNNNQKHNMNYIHGYNNQKSQNNNPQKNTSHNNSPQNNNHRHNQQHLNEHEQKNHKSPEKPDSGECGGECGKCKKPCFFGGLLDNIKNMFGLNNMFQSKKNRSENSGIIGNLKFDDLLLLAVIFLIYKSENENKDIVYILGYLFITGLDL